MRDNRQWIERTLRHEDGLAVPYNFMFTPPALRRAQERYGQDVVAAINLPIRTTGLVTTKPLYADPAQFGPTATDEFGVLWATSQIDRGTPIGPPLTAPTLSGYVFPDPARECRFTQVGQWCRQQEGNFRIVWVGDLWERATFMRGMENLLLDVTLETAFVEALLDGIAQYVLRTMEILFERFGFEGVGVSDDYGTQKAMVMSPQAWRTLVKPRLGRIYGLAKRHGRTIFHHSCGNIVPVIGDMIDLGLDILHPIQPEAMDGAMLKREFGRSVTFCGGLSTQGLLAGGTPQQVRDEVRRLKREMGRGGGYILEPGITIQADVPKDNIVAMIEEARRTED